MRRALALMVQYGVNALPVVNQQKFLGAVTRQSILENLLQREHNLLTETLNLKRNLMAEHEQVKSWSEKISRLHEASRTLLTVLATTSVQTDLLQIGIESLSVC